MYELKREMDRLRENIKKREKINSIGNTKSSKLLFGATKVFLKEESTLYIKGISSNNQTKIKNTKSLNYMQ